MAKYQNDTGYDTGLAWFADCDTVTVCSTQPTNYTEATVTYKLADVTVTAGDGNGDFTIGAGDVSGRKLTLAQQADVPIDADGTAAHVAICQSVGTTLRYVTTCTSQALTSGGTVTIPTFDLEITDVA